MATRIELQKQERKKKIVRKLIMKNVTFICKINYKEQKFVFDMRSENTQKKFDFGKLFRTFA